MKTEEVMSKMWKRKFKNQEDFDQDCYRMKFRIITADEIYGYKNKGSAGTHEEDPLYVQFLAGALKIKVVVWLGLLLDIPFVF